MNHANVYNQIIERARNRTLEGYSERHHVQPRCLGGSNDAANLVDLTAREHYIAHALLTKMYPEHRGLAFAFHMMNIDNQHQQRYSNSFLYEKLKTQLNVRRMSKEHKAAIAESLRGKPKAASHRAKVSESLTGRTLSDETRAKMSETHKSRKRSASEYETRRGQKRPEHGALMAEKMKGKHKGKRKYNDGVREYLCLPEQAHPQWVLGRLT